MWLVRIHDDITPEEKKCIFKTEYKFPKTRNAEMHDLNENDEVDEEGNNLTSISTCSENCLMEEGECSRESSKCKDEYCEYDYY